MQGRSIYLGPRNVEWLVNLSFARHWLRASFNTAYSAHGKIKINWIEHFSAEVFRRNVVKTNPQGCFAYICILFLLFLKFQHPTQPILLRQKHRNKIFFYEFSKQNQLNIQFILWKIWSLQSTTTTFNLNFSTCRIVCKLITCLQM